MSAESVEKFMLLLKKSPYGAVFNPWWEVDEQNDNARNAPTTRRNQLHAYLEKRLGKAKLAVIGEALGYRGGHFTGIPMTSERLLLGRSKRVHIKPNDFFSNINPRRTEMCRRIFRTDGNNRMGHVLAAWPKARPIRAVECIPVAFVRFAPRHVE